MSSPDKDRWILPGIGFGRLRFGMDVDQVSQLLGGNPASLEVDEDGDTIIQCKELGIDLLSFEKDEQNRLTIIEINSISQAILWGKRVFDMQIKDISALARQNEHTLEKTSNISFHTGQQSYQLKSLNLDFYCSIAGKLQSISIGVLIDESDEIMWSFALKDKSPGL